jgi:hypothetical protein
VVGRSRRKRRHRVGFSATWAPFETRKDYWGTYDYNAATGDLTLHAIAGPANYTPSDIKPHGTATLDPKGRLLLKDIWLGTPPPGLLTSAGKSTSTLPRACGHVFVVRGR